MSAVPQNKEFFNRGVLTALPPPFRLITVPREWLVEIARHAAGTGYPLHIHAGEQPREVAESLDEFGLRPIEHLQDCGVLGPGATVVHATHVSPGELEWLWSRFDERGNPHTPDGPADVGERRRGGERRQQ